MSGKQSDHDRMFLEAQRDAFYAETGVWPPGREIPKARRGTKEAFRDKFWQFWLDATEKCRVRDEQLERIQRAAKGVVRLGAGPDSCHYCTGNERAHDKNCALGEVEDVLYELATRPQLAPAIIPLVARGHRAQEDERDEI